MGGALPGCLTLAIHGRILIGSGLYLCRSIGRILKAYIRTRKAVKRWLLRTLEPCRQVVPLMSESMDRRLGISEHLKLRLHLIVCVWCARYLQHLKFMRQIMALQPSVNDVESETHLSVEARERIASNLNLHS